ncbi:MAG: alpha/beta fold hydrolase [Flavobacteriales bacterium]|nr:alpha/beta fold hydrolase [Flavobacteriales bacterium]
MNSKHFITNFLLIIFLFSCKTDTKSDISTEDKTETSLVSETVEINGVNHYISKMGNGEAILVLHGGPGLFQDYLTPYFGKLAEKYQLFFYDQRGCGKTEFPKDTASININQYIEDIEAIRKHLKLDKIILAGHSWGANLALMYGKKYSDNLKNLILISPAPANTEFYDQMFKNMQSKRTDEDIKKLVKVMSSSEFDSKNPPTILEAVKIGDKVNFADQTKAEEFYKKINFTEQSAGNMLVVSSILEKNFFNYSIIDSLNNIKCPTLIVIGDLDNIPFASAQLIQDNLPKARLEVIQHASLYPFFETPKEFNSIISNFLDPEYEQ